jgi:uncharacterized membrane protein YeaQ/YmgE (transglycosylase-associated protein family)
VAGFLASVFAGAVGAFVIGEVIGTYVETGAWGPCGGPACLDFLVWPIGAIAVPMYLYNREKRRRRRATDTRH